MNYDNPFEQALSGLEIKDWIWHHTQNKTKYTALAKTMGALFNLLDNKIYMLKLCDDEVKVVEVPEKNKKYDIPCE